MWRIIIFSVFCQGEGGNPIQIPPKFKKDFPPPFGWDLHGIGRSLTNDVKRAIGGSTKGLTMTFSDAIQRSSDIRRSFVSTHTRNLGWEHCIATNDLHQNITLAAAVSRIGTGTKCPNPQHIGGGPITVGAETCHVLRRHRTVRTSPDRFVCWGTVLSGLEIRRSFVYPYTESRTGALRSRKFSAP